MCGFVILNGVKLEMFFYLSNYYYFNLYIFYCELKCLTHLIFIICIRICSSLCRNVLICLNTVSLIYICSCMEINVVLCLIAITSIHSNCSSVSKCFVCVSNFTTLIFIYDCVDCSVLFCRIVITCLCSRVDRKYHILSNQYYYIVSICYS